MDFGQSLFPPPHLADEHGMLALSRDLSVPLLLDAYSHGIFPWSENPVRWYSPNPRAVFFHDRIHLPSRLARDQRKAGFVVTLDTAFDAVMAACAEVPRADGSTWIGPEFRRVYGELHRKGYAHSVEVWQDESLVGGLYGVQIGGLFAGESMFHRVPNASKVAFGALVGHLKATGNVVIDAQVLNDHTERLGAVEITRDEYLGVLARAIRVRTPFDAQLWTPSGDAR